MHPSAFRKRQWRVIAGAIKPQRRAYFIGPDSVAGARLRRIWAVVCNASIRRGFRDAMTVRLHRGDLPDLSRYTDSVAIDTETMGLNPHRDRLCVVQLSNGDGSADVVQIPKDHGKNPSDARNLKALLGNPKVTKI